MSRIGKKPIPIESGVDVAIQGGTIVVKGKHGELSFAWHPNMTVEYDSDARQVCVTRPNDHRQNRALHGLTRSLINNMVCGVSTPFEKRLEIVGVGYNATIQDKTLRLQVGYANTVELPIPDIVNCETVDPTHVVGLRAGLLGLRASPLRAHAVVPTRGGVPRGGGHGDFSTRRRPCGRGT